MILTEEDKIKYIEEFKLKEIFTIDDWEDQELDMPEDSVVLKMKAEVHKVCDFLILQIQKQVSNLQTQVQLYYNAWDTEDFENDHIEFMVVIMYEPLRVAGINIDNLII